jgi:hypothetical protein
MRRFGFALGVAALLLATAHARPGDDKEARALLDQAIKAHGGAALEKIKAHYFKGTGTVHVGDDFPFTAEVYFMGTTHSKSVIEVTAAGQVFRLTTVLAGDKGWKKVNNEATVDLKAEELTEERMVPYTFHLASLGPLKDKAYKLAILGEAKVNDQPAMGLRVSRDGYRDAVLYFDKKTHMLVKLEMSISDQGQEFMQEVFFLDYKAIDGVQQAQKVTLKRDGKPYIDAQFTEVRVYEQKLDANLFEKP